MWAMNLRSKIIQRVNTTDSAKCPTNALWIRAFPVTKKWRSLLHVNSTGIVTLCTFSSSRPHNVRNNVWRDARTFSTAIVRVQCLPVGPQPRFCTLRLCGVVSGHSAVHFFNIATSKSAPNLGHFVHFDLELRFAPQRGALFHLSSRQVAPRPPL